MKRKIVLSLCVGDRSELPFYAVGLENERGIGLSYRIAGSKCVGGVREIQKTEMTEEDLVKAIKTFQLVLKELK